MSPFPSFRTSIAAVPVRHYALLAATFILVLACNESLPTYSPPPSLFQGKLRGNAVWTKTNVLIFVYFAVENVYTETLQGHGRLSGLLEITYPPDPTFHKTITLDSTNFVNPGYLNTHTGVVTIDPGDSLTFLYKWDLIDDNGKFLGDDLNYKSDPNCPTIRRADPATLVFTCSFQVFDALGQVSAPTGSYVFSYWYGSPC